MFSNLESLRGSVGDSPKAEAFDWEQMWPYLTEELLPEFEVTPNMTWDDLTLARHGNMVDDPQRDDFEKSLNNAGRHPLNVALASAIEKGLDPEKCVDALFRKALKVKKQVEETIRRSKLSGEPLPTAEFTQGGRKQEEWLYQNSASNWVRLMIPPGKSVLGLADIPYEEVHKRKIYKFSERKLSEDRRSLKDRVTDVASDLARYLIASQGPEVVKDKRVCVLGSGTGLDDLYFHLLGAQLVVSVDKAPFAQEATRENLDKASPRFVNDFAQAIQSKTRGVYIEKDEARTDIFQFLKEIKKSLRQGGSPFDVIFLNSVAHLFEPCEIAELLKLIKEALPVGGKLAMSMRDLGGLNDSPKSGILLLQDFVGVEVAGIQDDSVLQSLFRTHGLDFRFNNDGETRTFLGPQALETMLEKRHLVKRVLTTERVCDYGVPGSVQDFHFSITQREENRSRKPITARAAVPLSSVSSS